MRLTVSSRTGKLLVVAGILLLVAMSPAAPQTTTSTTVAVMGDLGIHMDAERNVDRAVLGGAQGMIGLGDYNYDGSLRGWNAMVSPLASKGAWFARGNHDSLASFKPYMPGQTPTWSTTIAGVRVIGIDTEQRIDSGTTQYNWFVAELSREPASAGKIVVMHKPWWLGAGATHPGSEFPGSGTTMDGLMKAHGVDLVFAGHEHNYQRTARNNIPYLVVGTGGRSIYPVAGSDPATVATCACIGHALLTISPSSLQTRFVKLDGTQTDSVSVPLATGFSATFTPKSLGNPNWVEVEVAGSSTVTKAYASINGGPWYLLIKQDAGTWARALSAPSGSAVKFRAFNAANEYATSATYTWTAQASPTLSATFTPQAVGNNDWVEVQVTSSSTITKAYASINGGPWYLLVKQEWGTWGRSLSAPDGSTVKFRAFNAANEYATSSTYTWT